MKFFDPSDPNSKPGYKKWTEEEYKALIAKFKAEFTAADLQKFTEEEEGIPMEDVLKELEHIQRQHKPRPE